MLFAKKTKMFERQCSRTLQRVPTLRKTIPHLGMFPWGAGKQKKEEEVKIRGGQEGGRWGKNQVEISASGSSCNPQPQDGLWKDNRK